MVKREEQIRSHPLLVPIVPGCLWMLYISLGHINVKRELIIYLDCVKVLMYKTPAKVKLQHGSYRLTAQNEWK